MPVYISTIEKLEEANPIIIGLITQSHSFADLEKIVKELSEKNKIKNPGIVASLKFKESNPLHEMVYSILKEEDLKWVRDVVNLDLCLLEPSLYIIDGEKYTAA